MFTRFCLIVCIGLLAACNGSAVDNGSDAAEQPSTSPATPNPSPAAGLPRKPAPEGAAAYIISPQNGAVVSSPVRVVFGLRGAGVAPAGVERPSSGHHHLLIDSPVPPLNLPIPSAAGHVHFGGGQTETSVTLMPGRHTLQLLLGDELHVPHDPPLLSEVVTIEVR
jgi:hypothetical protein